jgi:hypothetical protein
MKTVDEKMKDDLFEEASKTHPSHDIIVQARKDSKVYRKHALPLKVDGETFSQDVIGKDSSGMLGIICFDYDLDCWLSHTDMFDVEEDFVWSYPSGALIDEVV